MSKKIPEKYSTSGVNSNIGEGGKNRVKNNNDNNNNNSNHVNSLMSDTAR